FYRRGASADPESPRGHEAAVRFGALQYLAGEALAAASAFSGAPGKGVRRQRLDFWAALSHRSTGDTSSAQELLQNVLKLDPLTYYGMRAAELLDAPKPAIAPGTANDENTPQRDRKSTRLNSSHVKISYAVFCLKKKMIAAIK